MALSGPSGFASTHWSLVASAGRRLSPDSSSALADLCQRYWYPLYVFVRRSVSDLDEARDLTQEFFARLLEKNTLALADPERGRFRTFLLAALRNFLHNERTRARSQKRGGGRAPLTLDFDSKDSRQPLEPAHRWSAERLYERQWAITLLDNVLARLQAEYEAAGKAALFQRLKSVLAAESASAPHADIAAELAMSPGAVKVAAHRLRRRYRELLRDEVGQTVADEQDIDEEVRSLFRSLAE
jgi:RNA polymerase sigma-70 factor (ECF subfamily)